MMSYPRKLVLEKGGREKHWQQHLDPFLRHAPTLGIIDRGKT